MVLPRMGFPQRRFFLKRLLCLLLSGFLAAGPALGKIGSSRLNRLVHASHGKHPQGKRNLFSKRPRPGHSPGSNHSGNNSDISSESQANLQEQMQNASQSEETISNVEKSENDTQQSVVGNIKK